MAVSIQNVGDKASLYSQRSLKELGTHNESQGFSIVTYNTLADSALLSSPDYRYCKEIFKKRNGKNYHRHKLLMEELKWLDSDILCLQEVDISYFDNLLHGELCNLGYKGLFTQHVGCKHGLAVFFKDVHFELVEKKDAYMNDLMEEACEKSDQMSLIDHLKVPTAAMMLALRHSRSKKMLVLGNVHLNFDWYGYPVRLTLQTAMATKMINDFTSTLSRKLGAGSLIPHILCGDFNIESQFPAYQLLKAGSLAVEEYEKLKYTKYCKFYENSNTCTYCEPQPDKISDNEYKVLQHLKEHFKSHMITAKSAYQTVMGREPSITNHEGGNNSWILDYIWYSSESLQPIAALDTVPKAVLDQYDGLPNEFFPSDHLSLKAYFDFIE